MEYLRQTNMRIRRAMAPGLIFLTLAYFAYHAIQGNHGLLALGELERELVTLQVEAVAVSAERQALEQLVEGLRPEAVDPDLLEERARAVLGFIRADEVILPLPKTGAPTVTPPVLKGKS